MSDQKPFFYYSESFAKVLSELNISLAFSTYQAGKLIFVSSINGKKLYKYAKNFKRPMGIDYSNGQLAIASRNFIEIYSSSKKLAKSFPEDPGKYDRLFIPQVKYYTGRADMHDVSWSNGKLLAVNTAFSSICEMSPTTHFNTVWKPDFVSELVPEDRCHLNGMIAENGKPAYVTYFNDTDYASGWRSESFRTGKLLEIETGQVLLDHLPMPHSPIKMGNTIYVLCSASGEVWKYNLETGESDIVVQINSFLRGVDIIGNYMFIGASKMREDSKTFKSLPISKSSFCGIVVIDLRKNEQVASLTYTDIIKEIYSVKIIKDTRIPMILSENDADYDKCIDAGEDQKYWMLTKEQLEELSEN